MVINGDISIYINIITTKLYLMVFTVLALLGYKNT